MSFDLLSAAIFVTITTFTPGPSNVSCASLGMKQGYKNTLEYIIGIVMGYLLVISLCAFLSTALLNFIPSIEPYLRIIAALYILKLAYTCSKESFVIEDQSVKSFGIIQGFILSVLNFKAYIFGITIYSTLFSSLFSKPFLLIVSVLILGLMTFLSVSSWTMLGCKVNKYLHFPVVKKSFNILLSLLLVYCAVGMLGISK